MCFEANQNKGKQNLIQIFPKIEKKFSTGQSFSNHEKWPKMTKFTVCLLKHQGKLFQKLKFASKICLKNNDYLRKQRQSHQANTSIQIIQTYNYQMYIGVYDSLCAIPLYISSFCTFCAARLVSNSNGNTDVFCNHDE